MLKFLLCWFLIITLFGFVVFIDFVLNIDAKWIFMSLIHYDGAFLQILSSYTQSVWQAFMRHEFISKDPILLSFIPKLFETSTKILLKVSALTTTVCFFCFFKNALQSKLKFSKNLFKWFLFHLKNYCWYEQLYSTLYNF